MVWSTFWVHVSEPTLYSGSRFARPPLDPFPPQATLLVTPPPSSALPPCDVPSCDMMPSPIVPHPFVISVVIIFQGGVKMSRCMSSFLHAPAKKKCCHFFTRFSQYFHNMLAIVLHFLYFCVFLQYFHIIFTIF